MNKFIWADGDIDIVAPGAKAATPVRASDLAWLFSHDTWRELRAVLLPRIAPLFSEAFLVGAQLGAQQRPSRRGAKDDDGIALFEVARVMLREKYNENHDPDNGQFTGPGGGGVGGAGSGPRVASGKTVDEVVHNMAPQAITYINPDARPDLFEKHPRSGFMVRNDNPAPHIIDVDGKPMVQDTVPTKSPGGVRMGGAETPVGEPHPPKYLFRSVSEEDWEGIQRTGYMKSDERMNLGPHEGTVASLDPGTFYLPGALHSDTAGDYPGRILRIAYHSSDGWTYNAKGPDSYVKTQERIPLAHIDMVSPVIVQQVEVNPATGNARRTLTLGSKAIGQRDTGVQPPKSTKIVARQPLGPLPVLPFDFEAVNNASQNTIATYSDAWWRQFSDSTQRSLRKIIANAEANGFTMPQVIALVEPLFGPERAMRIAVSEVTNLLGMGAQETYQQAGFASWTWRSVRDAFVDPVCFLRDGQSYPMSVLFERAHVACRCWPVPSGAPVVPPMLARYLGGPFLQ